MIGAELKIETGCLPILDMVYGCAASDLAMLRWIAYIKSLNPEIRHISRKDNAMANMLSTTQLEEEVVMVSEDEEVGVDFFESAQMMANKRSTPAMNEFNEDDYEGEWVLIGRFLSTMTTDASWAKEEASRLGKKEYKFFLWNKKICQHRKKLNGTPLQVVTRKVDQSLLMTQFGLDIEGHGQHLRS